MKYIEFMQYTEFYALDKLVEKLSHYNGSIKDYSYIVHNKDILEDGTPKKEHFHCVIEFNADSYTIERLAQMFEIEPQYLEKVKSYNNALSYLCHRTKEATHKAQYDPSDVHSSLDYPAKLQEITEAVKEAKNRQDEIEQLCVSYGKLEINHRRLISQLTPMEYHKNKKLIDNMATLRSEKAKYMPRNMQVVYIFGLSGTGKTTFGKYLAMKQGYDIFISGSGKDVLDGYDNEDCIILDDLRADAFTKAELFKLLDNNTPSSVKSRYRNKNINNCKLLIITSVKAPDDLYDWSTIGVDKSETSKQLARRLNNEMFVVGVNGNIYVRALNDLLKPRGDEQITITMSDVFKTMDINPLVSNRLRDLLE